MKPHEMRHWRLDRWLTLAAARPWSALLARPAEAALPVLMYHSVAEDVDDSVHPYLRTVTTPATFERQMTQLAQAGWQAVGLGGAARLLAAARRPGDPQAFAEAARKTVVVTFDDGLRDFALRAWPVLERLGFSATVFLVSGYVGRRFVTGRPCLSAAEVWALAERGVEFGSHTVSHPRLVELPARRILDELLNSRRAIEDMSGRAVTQFSYPYRFPQEDAAFGRRFGLMLDECGYDVGVTTVIGRARPRDDLRLLPRLPINECDDPALFAAKLAGHYDWLRGVQHARKQVRALVQRQKVAA